MKREYNTGTSSNAMFFIGNEVEKTKFYGVRTLFVVGAHSYQKIIELANEHGIDHVFIGANHSYDRSNEMRHMLYGLLEYSKLKLTVDCSFYDAVILANGIFADYRERTCIIAQLECPGIDSLLSYGNAYIKLDDVDFNCANPSGVYVLPIDRATLNQYNTPWSAYTADTIIGDEHEH